MVVLVRFRVAAHRRRSFRIGSGLNRSSNSDSGQNRFGVHLGYFESFGLFGFVLVRFGSPRVVANRFGSVPAQTEAQILTSARTSLKSTLVVSSRSGSFGSFWTALVRFVSLQIDSGRFGFKPKFKF